MICSKLRLLKEKSSWLLDLGSVKLRSLTVTMKSASIHQEHNTNLSMPMDTDALIPDRMFTLTLMAMQSTWLQLSVLSLTMDLTRRNSSEVAKLTTPQSKLLAILRDTPMMLCALRLHLAVLRLHQDRLVPPQQSSLGAHRAESRKAVLNFQKDLEV